MVDELRVQRLLRGIADTVAFLESERDQPEQVRAQRRWLDSVKYNFVAAIEAAVDVGQHVCATEQWGPPDTNAATFHVLRDHAVLSPGVAEAMARACGFRNVLVHEYVAVRDDLVIANLDRLSDLRAFVAEVASWLSAA